MLNLPCEIWETVFRNLDVQQLLVIRLTCGHFRDIVSNCPSLRDRFCLRFSKIGHDPDRNPLSVPAASSVEFSHSTLKDIDSWWPSVGEMITSLTLTECAFQMDMLAQTPNLKRLEIKNGSANGATLNYKLEKLEHLVLTGVDSTIWEGLTKFIPHLKGLDCSKYDFYAIDDDQIETHLRMFEAMQGSLSEIKVYAKPTLMEGLSNLPKLKLRCVTVQGIKAKMTDESKLLEFLRAQPTIEKLCLVQVYIEDDMLQNVGKALPNLKHFEMCVFENRLPTFLDSMTNVEYLCLKGLHEESFDYNLTVSRLIHMQCLYNFNIVEFPNLKQLKICGSSMDVEMLYQFLNYSKSLRYIQLVNCHVNQFELQRIIMQSENAARVLILPKTQCVLMECRNVDEQILHNIGKVLPYQKRLTVRANSTLENLVIRFLNGEESNQTPFSHCTTAILENKNNNLLFSNLEELHLVEVSVEELMLSRVLCKALNFHTLKLDRCILEDSKLISLIMKLKRMQNLQLSNMDLTVNMPIDDESSANLKTLFMQNIRISDADLSKLIFYLPQLTVLFLNYEEGTFSTLLPDELIEELCRRCQLLEKFSLDHRRCISLNSLRTILKNMNALQYLDVKYAKDPSLEVQKLIRITSQNTTRTVHR